MLGYNNERDLLVKATSLCLKCDNLSAVRRGQTEVKETRYQKYDACQVSDLVDGSKLRWLVMLKGGSMGKKMYKWITSAVE